MKVSNRVTNTSMTRNYLKNLNRSLNLLNESEEKLETGRKITKMSDSVSAGTRALNVRTQMYKNEQIQENVKKAGETLEVAESNLTSIEEIIDDIHAKTITALNGTNISEASIFEYNFDSIKEQIVQFANCQYNGSYILGGTNAETAPFTVDDDGNLLFNGVNVNEISKENGQYVANGDKVPFSDSVYIDIGIGMAVNNGKIDPRTAFNMSVSGLECLGYGTTEIKYTDQNGEEQTIEAPNNAYELIDEMARCLENKDYDKLGVLNDHLKKTFDNLVTEISDIGIRTNYLDNHTTRLESEEDVLTKIQLNLEYIKDTDELVNQKNFEYSWLLTLQFGAKVIPQSLMDYIQ